MIMTTLNGILGWQVIHTGISLLMLIVLVIIAVKIWRK